MIEGERREGIEEMLLICILFYQGNGIRMWDYSKSIESRNRERERERERERDKNVNVI